MTIAEVPVSSANWPATTLSLCGSPFSYRKSGSGPALVVLPHETGYAPRTEFLDALALDFTVYAPWLPGFHGGHPAEWEWLTNVRDLVAILRQAVDALGLDRPHVVGLGFGGWLAAEMAAMGGSSFGRLALVSPMGIQPRAGFIHDQFLGSTESYCRLMFSDQSKFDAIYTPEPDFEQLESWETDREMTARLAWKPYMYNPALPGLMAGVSNPVLIVTGDDDRIVPAECATRYEEAIPGARLTVLPGAGHAVDLEQPTALASAVASFLRA